MPLWDEMMEPVIKDKTLASILKKAQELVKDFELNRKRVATSGDLWKSLSEEEKRYLKSKVSDESLLDGLLDLVIRATKQRISMNLTCSGNESLDAVMERFKVDKKEVIKNSRQELEDTNIKNSKYKSI